MTRRTPFTLLLLLSALASACVSVQDYGDGAPGPADAPAEATGDAPVGVFEPKPVDGAPSWHWANPAPTGRTLFGVGGTSERDVWVAGEGGLIAHFDGTQWDKRWERSAALDPAEPPRGDGARYSAIGTRAKDDVWIAGELDGKVEVVHYDGTTWTKSYPFAGSSFGGFSHGPGKRLFAITDWDLLELEAGKWERTDTSANGVFGPPASVWVSASGEAWTITTGAKVLRLPAGSKKWELQPPLPGVPQVAVGLAISGVGSDVCVFYTGRPAATGGAGFLRYDGAWHASPTSVEPLPLGTERHGTRAACLADGTGVMAYLGDIVVASETSAPAVRSMVHFPGERLFAAWSPDGNKVFTAGSLGAFLARSSGSPDWKEQGPTRRRDLLSADRGLDGTVVLADASQPDHRSGGDVLFGSGGSFAPSKGSGFSGPSIPVAVTALAADDVWTLANDGSRVGVAHWTGKWSVTRTLAGASGQPTEPLAIWAPAKDDVWATATGAVWHYDGTTWKPVATGATYRSIHGSGPSDVWLAGDGLAHWDGKKLMRLAEPTGAFTGVWASAPGRVWLWGERALLFDGVSSVPVETVLHASTEWVVAGIAEAASGDVFVLTKEATGTSLLWFDPTRTKLIDLIGSDLELTGIRGRGDRLWAFGAGGALLEFGPTPVR